LKRKYFILKVDKAPTSIGGERNVSGGFEYEYERMRDMKRVIVACGSGVATSQTVASKVNRLLKENKIDARVDVVDLKSIDRHIDSSVAYIAITKVTKEYPIPVINGIAFLTGVNQDAELKKLIEACK